MANTSVIKKIFSISPYIELAVRHIYWKNIDFFSSVKNNVSKKSRAKQPKVDFNNIVKFINRKKEKSCDLLLVHSSYPPLEGSRLNPVQIIDELLSIVGEEGTLAMPAAPVFKNTASMTDYLKEDEGEVFEYNVKTSPIKTGLLPAFLHRKKGSRRSRHPINTMVAFGRLSETLMQDNISGISPLACGINSSWKKCVDLNACIVSIGTDLTHALTMIHVAEDVQDEKWAVKNWYRDKTFLIKDGEFCKSTTLRERNPKWGALHFAERTLCKDLIDEGILSSTIIDGVIVEVLDAKKLMEFLDGKNSTGYPYFGVKKWI